MIFDTIKEAVTTFFGSSLVTKLLIFISAFMAPTWELYLLLIFLTCTDYCMDLGVWFFSKGKDCKHWQITQPFILKLIMYSILVIVIQAVQNHLIKDDFQIFKLVLSIPIISETLGIVTTIEKITGIAIVQKLKDYLGNWISSKEPRKED